MISHGLASVSKCQNLTSKVLNVLKIQFARDLEMERIWFARDLEMERIGDEG